MLHVKSRVSWKIRQILVQMAHVAARQKKCYLAAQYRRIAARRGSKRAAIVVAHRILVSIYHLLSESTTYQERGETFFDKRDRDMVEHRLINQLTHLGYQVELQPTAQAG